MSSCEIQHQLGCGQNVGKTSQMANLICTLLGEPNEAVSNCIDQPRPFAHILAHN